MGHKTNCTKLTYYPYQHFTKCNFAQIAPVVSSTLKEKIASVVRLSLVILVTTP